MELGFNGVFMVFLSVPVILDSFVSALNLWRYFNATLK